MVWEKFLVEKYPCEMQEQQGERRQVEDETGTDCVPFLSVVRILEFVLREKRNYWGIFEKRTSMA